MTNATPWIIVDFDNTLMGTENLAMPSLIARFNTLYGDKIPEALSHDVFFKNFQGFARENLCAALGKHYNIHVDYPLLFAERETSVTAYFRKVGVPMAPNLIEAMSELRDKHQVRFAVATNNLVARCLSAMRFASNGKGEELAAFFGTHLYEAYNPQAKPDPEVYLRAVTFSNTDPQHTYAVEDSVTGVRASLAAGLKTFGFVGYADHPDIRTRELLNLGVVACFTDWAEFPALWRLHANR